MMIRNRLYYSVSLQVIFLASSFGLGAGILGASQEEDVPAIVAHMRVAGRSLRQLRAQVSDPTKKEENLALIAAMKQGLRDAQKEEPLKTPELPEAEREPFLKEFRSRIDAVVAALDELSEAVAQGNLDLAKELLVKTNDLRVAGHEKFQKPEE